MLLPNEAGSLRRSHRYFLQYYPKRLGLDAIMPVSGRSIAEIRYSVSANGGERAGHKRMSTVLWIAKSASGAKTHVSTSIASVLKNQRGRMRRQVTLLLHGFLRQS